VQSEDVGPLEAERGRTTNIGKSRARIIRRATQTVCPGSAQQKEGLFREGFCAKVEGATPGVPVPELMAAGLGAGNGGLS